MKNPDKNIHEELKSLNSELPGSDKANPYAVPEGYFDGLASAVLARVKENELSTREEIQTLSPLLASIDRSIPYEIPAGYFDQTIEMLPVLTGEDQRSAILELVEQQTPYEVPNEYFDKLPSMILGRTAQKTPVVHIRRRWMKLAVAAVFAGIIALSGYYFLDARNNASLSVERQLSNVSNQELEEFIKTTSMVSGKEVVITPENTREVKSLLYDVADTELDDFLQQVPDVDLLSFN
jgi:hypothetical protein